MLLENEEPLVLIEPIPNRLYVEQSYFKQGISTSLNTLYLRKQAKERLFQALHLLPENYSFILYDGFRPLQVQQALFEKFYQHFANKYPHFTNEQLQQETLKYVAFPSIDKHSPAPHITGGAIDLTLGDVHGNPLDLGTNFDETSEKSATAYFETSPHENEEALLNRRLLFHAMTAVGFQNYEEEWWHYDFGNPSWARKSKSPHAIYGPIIATVEQHELKEYRFK